ncbi:MAG: hypothetical protein UIM24_03020 [Clostridia bacterium]|nr:hypothetical protein [Clostridia bacterium]
MNENNLPNIDGEENLTPVEETTEEIAVEDVAEVEETADEEVSDEILDGAEEVLEETFEEVFEDEDMIVDAQQVADFAEEVKAKGGAGKVVAIVIVIVAILAAAGFGVFKYLTRNPYNAMGYVNVSGRTIEEVAESVGMSLDEFLAEYGLPADMPADTEEAAAFYNIPVSKIAEMYGMDMATLKEMLGLGDDVTDNTPWGEAEGKSPLKKYVGEDNIESFKAEYGLGEEVTGETLWGEIRNIVDQKTLEKQQEAEKNAAAEGDVAEDANADGDVVEEDAAEGETEEAPAE